MYTTTTTTLARAESVLEDIRVSLSGFPGFAFVPAQPCTRDDLLTVHTTEYVNRMLMPAPAPAPAPKAPKPSTASPLGADVCSPVEMSLLAVGA